MKFKFNDVENLSEQIEKDLKNINRYLNEIKDGLDIITSSNNWKSPTHDFYVNQLKDSYDSIQNFDILARNINAYLEGILNNYRQMGTQSTNLFSKFFGK